MQRSRRALVERVCNIGLIPAPAALTSAIEELYLLITESNWLHLELILGLDFFALF